MERMRALVRESAGHRQQLRFLTLIDVIDQELSRGSWSLEAVQTTIARAKAVSRKELSDDSTSMTKLINGFDLLEQDVVRVYNQGR